MHHALMKTYPPSPGFEKKAVKSIVAAKNGCDGRQMAKFVMMTIQVNLVWNVEKLAQINLNHCY